MGPRGAIAARPPATCDACPMDEDSAGFADLGLRPELLASASSATRSRRRSSARRSRRCSPAATCSARPRPAPARPPRSRCRCSQRARRGGGATADPSRSCWCRPASWPCRCPRRCYRYGRELGVAGRCRSTAASRSAGSSQRPRARRRRRRRHPGPGARPHRPRHAARSTTSRSSCSTRPTRCSTWASPRTSRRSSTRTPDERQTVLFSATMPPRIDGIARRHLHDPVRIQIGRGRRRRARPPLVRQSAYIVARAHKPAALGRILDVEAPTAAIVFCRTRNEVDQLTETLNGRGYRAEALHGGMSQEQRDRVMGRLRAGTADLLVATDVAARGLDIDSSPTSSTTTCRRRPRPTCTASAASAGPGARAWRSRWPSRASTGCSANIERVTRQTITIEKVPTRRRPARPPAGADVGRRARARSARRRPRPTSARGRDARRRVRRVRGRRWPRSSSRTRPAGGRRSTRRRSPTSPTARPERPPAEYRRTGRRPATRRPARRAGAGRRARPRCCSSASAARPASGRATWSARSPTRPGSSGRDIGAIEIAAASRSSGCRPTRVERRRRGDAAAPSCAASGWSCAATPTSHRRPDAGPMTRGPGGAGLVTTDPARNRNAGADVRPTIARCGSEGGAGSVVARRSC